MARGLLSSKFTNKTTFEKEDHRFFNRNGDYFDKGETFSGVPFDVGLKAVGKIKDLFPKDQNLAALALRWILDFPQVGIVIPGASRVEQVKQNISASELPSLTTDQKVEIEQIYEEMIKPFVHQLW